MCLRDPDLGELPVEEHAPFGEGPVCPVLQRVLVEEELDVSSLELPSSLISGSLSLSRGTRTSEQDVPDRHEAHAQDLGDLGEGHQGPLGGVDSPVPVAQHVAEAVALQLYFQVVSVNACRFFCILNHDIINLKLT